MAETAKPTLISILAGQVLSAAIYGAFMGLCAFFAWVTTQVLHWESKPKEADAFGVALAILLLCLALVTSALIWAWRMARRPGTAQSVT